MCHPDVYNGQKGVMPMFTHDDRGRVLIEQPFIPFRVFLSDGRGIDVRSRKVVLPSRRFAIVGLPDPDATDTLFERWTVFWYLHVRGVEFLAPGAPPFSA